MTCPNRVANKLFNYDIVGQGHHNTGPRTWWLKATAIYSQSEARSQGVGRALLFGEALGEGPSMPFPLPVVPWLVAVSLPSLPPSSHDFVPRVSVRSPFPVAYKVNS